MTNDKLIFEKFFKKGFILHCKLLISNDGFIQEPRRGDKTDFESQFCHPVGAFSVVSVFSVLSVTAQQTLLSKDDVDESRHVGDGHLSVAIDVAEQTCSLRLCFQDFDEGATFVKCRPALSLVSLSSSGRNDEFCFKAAGA